MDFDRFLAKIFSKKGLICTIAILVLVVFLSSCSFTADDWFLCLCLGCVTPETCFQCGNSCMDCTDNLCSDCFWSCTSCIDCSGFHSPEYNENLAQSCIGKTTVSIFDCINDCCEE